MPGTTGFGEAALLTERSGCATVPTIVVAVARLLAAFGSETTELTCAVSAITVPFGVKGFTHTMTVNSAVPGGISDAVQTSVPPGPGMLHIHPAGGVTLRNVVFAGIVSENVRLVASLGPLLVIVCV